MESWEMDLARYEAEQARGAARCPVCSKCGETIFDEYYYDMEDGRILCEECLNEEYRRSTDDYYEDHFDSW